MIGKPTPKNLTTSHQPGGFFHFSRFAHRANGAIQENAVYRKDNKKWTKQEVIAAIRRCAEELGHVPSLDELLRITKMSKYAVRRHFGPYVNALEACGLERHGCGYKVDLKKLFLDWAAMVRKLGKTPSMLDYELHGKYTVKPLVRHYGGWTHVPA